MRILAIDLGERELRVARAVRTLGAVRLGAVERIAFADRAELSAALERLAASRPQAIVTALPAALVTHRILTFPFRGRHRLAATVPFELLGQLPAAPDDPVVAFERLARTESGTVVVAAAARRADVDASLEPLVAAGLAPARVDLAPLPVWNLVPAAAGDTALVLADGERSALSVRRGGRIAGLRALGAAASEPTELAAEVQWALAALGGAPPTIVVTGPDAVPVAAALGAVPLRELAATTADTEACAVAVGLVAGGRHGVAFDVGPGARGTSLRPIAALALLALVLGAVDLGIVRHDLSRRRRALPHRGDGRRDPGDGGRPRGRVQAARRPPPGGSELVTDRVVAWLAGRSGRERGLLAAAAASAVVLALTLAVLAVHDDLAALRRQVAAHERELAGVRVLARRLAAGRPARAASDDAPLLADVQEATDRVVGRGRIASLTPASGPAADG